MTLYDAILQMIKPFIASAKSKMGKTGEELVILSRSYAISKNIGQVSIESPKDYELGTEVLGVPMANGKYYIIGVLR